MAALLAPPPGRWPAPSRPGRRGAPLIAAALGGAAALAASGRGGPAFALAFTGEGSGVGGVGNAALAVGLAVFYAVVAKTSWTLDAQEATAGDPAPPPEGQKKPRIDAFDSLRFFLIAYIASGHFIATATRHRLVLGLVTQINVVVGAFFVLSGYVAAYTTTELGKRQGSKRLDNSVEFAVSRIMGFWPLHMLLLVLFFPMFFWVDASFSGVFTASWNAFLSTALLQAWFPLSAEVWNAPTWFLSAFSFALFALPYALRVLAVQKKTELRKALAFLTVLALVPRLSYTYDLRAWGIMEGMMSARTHPNYALFNAVRFSPFAALLEVLMGAVACRLVMLDAGREAEKAGSAATLLAAMLAVLGLRAVGVIQLNDMMVRSVIFIPLWIAFLMRIHRETVCPGGPKLLPKLLCNSKLQYLGGISFPIFIAHGPIGQLFYKKAVVMKLWGGPLSTPLPNGVHWFFGVYWMVVLVASALLNKYFMGSKTVQGVSKKMTAAILKVL